MGIFDRKQSLIDDALTFSGIVHRDGFLTEGVIHFLGQVCSLYVRGLFAAERRWIISTLLCNWPLLGDHDFPFGGEATYRKGRPAAFWRREVLTRRVVTEGMFGIR